MVQSTDINYGTLNESTGNWNGIIGMLQRKEVDLTIMDITILQERSKVFYECWFKKDSSQDDKTILRVHLNSI
jgi:hypothetical protein